MPFSKNKEIKEALQTDASSTPSLLALKRFNAEKDTSVKVTEFQTSDFTIWINFRLFIMSIGEGNGIPCEDDGIPGWIHHFGVDVDLARTNTK
jgi:hypothetical protein